MILYGSNKSYWKDSFIVKKINDANIYWDYLFITDHLKFGDVLKISKNYQKHQKIFCSLESSSHSLKYMRPYSHANFNITHKQVRNAFFYNIFAEDYLNNLMGEYALKINKNDRVIFVSSNLQKINYVEKMLGHKFNKISFYGSFANQVPRVTNQFHLDSRELIGHYKGAICIENSFEDGYIQGNFLFALLSGTVPIIKASDYILNNILLPESYLSFDNFCSSTEKENVTSLNHKSAYLLSGGKFLSNLALEYLDFLKNIDLNNIEKAISISQDFRSNIFTGKLK